MRGRQIVGLVLVVVGLGVADPSPFATPAHSQTGAAAPLRLWYRQPARTWVEALPVGNGRLGAMVFGNPAADRLQLNENTMWSGGPQDADNPQALQALPKIRELLFAGRYGDAQALADRTLIAKGPGSGRGNGAKDAFGSYQTLGDMTLAFKGHERTGDYTRELDLEHGVARLRYTRGAVAL